MGLRMQPRNEKFFALFGKAGDDTAKPRLFSVHRSHRLPPARQSVR
jgi:hypothetical protein